MGESSLMATATPSCSSLSNSTSSNISYKKDVPLFHGKEDEDYIQWSFTIALNNKINKFNDEEAAYAIGNKLRGAPVFYYQDYMRNCLSNNFSPSWIDIDKHLKKAYTNEAKQLNIRQKLRELKSRNFNSISAYTDEFSKLTAALEDVSELDKVDKYLSGLERDLSERILTYNPKTLLDTIQLVNTLGGFKKAVNVNLAT